MARVTRTFVAAAIVCATALLIGLSARPASADVIDPPGACSAAGTWRSEGVRRASAELSSTDVIEIPQKDRVRWEGAVAGAAAEGPRREISGEVQVDIAGLGSATVDSWGGSSVRYANEGGHSYHLPSVLRNVQIRLHGEHREAPEGTSAFTRVCSGSVYVQVKGSTFSNPLSIAALVGMALSGAGMVSAGVARATTTRKVTT